MRKLRIVSLALALALVLGLPLSATALDNVVQQGSASDLALSEFTLEKDPVLSYTVTGFTSLDDNVPQEYAESNQYVENYTVYFNYPDVQFPTLRGSRVIATGTVDVMNADSISVPVAGVSRLDAGNVDIPLRNILDKEEFSQQSRNNIHSILRTISVNVFYANSEEDVYNGETSLFVHKEDTPVSRGQQTQSFSKMYAMIYALDEYNGTQKREDYRAYHTKHDTTNELYGGECYVNTTKKDNTPDVIALAWNIGGAINYNDPSIQLDCAYNLQCYQCLMNNMTYYASNSYNKNSSDVAMHSTFSGTNMIYEIPDVGIGYCSHCGATTGTYPSSLRLLAKSDWYNIGGYNGTSGEVRTEYVHSFSSKKLIVTPVFSNLHVTFSFNLVETTDYERSWVYVAVSPL